MTLLAARNVSRHFGGLRAVDGVTLTVERAQIHALIGTNGAGKSTLINLLCGEVAPSAGRVEMMGLDVTRWSQPRRARAGLGRTYQHTTIFPSFSVRENCRLAAQARLQRPWDWLTPAERCDTSTTAAEGALARTGLEPLADQVAGTLSHGAKRQLEIAMCLATAPQILLLDEPLAGMGSGETENMLALLADLKTSHTILLVEHDMDAVFRISDRITVLVNGRVLASGSPQAIRANAEVQEAYLGDATA
ncbi:MAG: ABC transporter ATP-binding protein [Burkholderiaceae bacterium]|nr:ABC transporter ATP-binding protein [Burkholderiaceae bacterium]